MSKVMKASEFVEKLKDIALNYKTLYVMGCFGAPMTAANKKRYANNYSYNRQASRTKMINAATADTFGFDCVCLIKGVLWGWDGSKNKLYGGAKYTSNGVPDVCAGTMINMCSNLSTDFSNIKVGEAVFTPTHIGVYIGNGLAVECTPKWKNKVQITACNCVKEGYDTRTWTKHGELPYIEYDVPLETAKPDTSKPVSTTKPDKLPKIDVATKRDKSLSGKYEVTPSIGLHIRTGAGSKKTSLGVLKKGTVVTNYGYYNVASNGVKWLCVMTSNGLVGFCSSTYLKKR